MNVENTLVKKNIKRKEMRGSKKVKSENNEKYREIDGIR